MTSSEYRLVIDKIAPFTDYVYLHVKGEPLFHNELEEILEISCDFTFKQHYEFKKDEKKLRDIEFDVVMNK